MTRSQPSLATSSAWTPRRRVATRASTPSASSVAASTTVVVTGGASGVGYRLAREFVERGARVFVASRDGDRAMRAAESLGEDVVGVRCDVSVADDVEALMQARARGILKDMRLKIARGLDRDVKADFLRATEDA